MDIEDYRKDIERRVEEHVKSQRPYFELLNRNTPAEERVEGLRLALGSRTDEEIAAAVDVVRDRSERDDVRIATMASLAGPARTRNPLLDLFLSLLQDRSESAPVRHAALSALRQLRFTSQLLNDRNADYVTALRNLIDDPDEQLRENAIETLSILQDRPTQQRVLDSLTGNGPQLVRPEKAIQFMGLDPHAADFPMLRRIVTETDNEGVKREGVRVLGADTHSADLLERIFRDKGESASVRLASARSLNAIAPERFAQHATDVLHDSEEEAQLRTASLTALTSRPSLSQADAMLLDQSVDDIGKSTDNEQLKKAVATYKSTRSLK